MLTEIISFQKIKEMAEKKAKEKKEVILMDEHEYEELSYLINKAAAKTRLFKKRLEFFRFKKECGIEAEKIASNFKGYCNMFLVK